MERGRKLLVIGGSMDAIIPYNRFIDYYKKVIKELEGIDTVREFFCIFLISGFAHTVGGSGVQDVGMTGSSVTPRDPEHDVLCAMEQWVEKDIVPEHILGTNFKMGMSGLQFDYDRPAYAYPYIADFTGGDPNQSANYQLMKDADAY